MRGDEKEVLMHTRKKRDGERERKKQRGRENERKRKKHIDR